MFSLTNLATPACRPIFIHSLFYCGGAVVSHREEAWYIPTRKPWRLGLQDGRLLLQPSVHRVDIFHYVDKIKGKPSQNAVGDIHRLLLERVVHLGLQETNLILLRCKSADGRPGPSNAMLFKGVLERVDVAKKNSRRSFCHRFVSSVLLRPVSNTCRLVVGGIALNGFGKVMLVSCNACQ